MLGKVQAYKDSCGVMQFDFIPYYTESEIENDPNTGERIIDRIEGNLIDNLLTIDKYNQYHVYKEIALNSWSSTLIYSSRGLDNTQTLELWEQMQEEYERLTEAE